MSNITSDDIVHAIREDQNKLYRVVEAASRLANTAEIIGNSMVNGQGSTAEKALGHGILEDVGNLRDTIDAATL